MTKVDQFESVFRAAAKTPFRYQRVEVGSVLVVSDGDESAAADFGERARRFLSILDREENIRWRVVHGGEYSSVPELLALIEAERPGLICTYRHLHSDSWQWPYTLGEYVDVLTQATTTPVVVMPHPKRAQEGASIENTDVVLAMTDHLVGDDALVNWAARFTEENGQLILANVEDETTFERFMDVVGKIPSIDTETVRSGVADRLGRDARDYMERCRDGLDAAGVPLSVQPVVTSGHHIKEYQRLVEEHAADLLVMHTKVDDQLAMHGLAYSLAIELRSVPLLLL